MKILLKCTECEEILDGDYCVDDNSGITDIFIGVEPCKTCALEAKQVEHEATQDHFEYPVEGTNTP